MNGTGNIIEIEKMKDDAKKHEEEDAKLKEVIDLHNQADQLIYQTEKQLEEFKDKLDESVGAVVLQNPNFFGCLDQLSDIIELTHQFGALAVVSVYPMALSHVETPGAMGADIVTGEGQSLGLPLNFGGPYLGFFAAKKQLVRKMPGRIVGETEDKKGRRGYVLTLQAREQHIRREKATSNICSNVQVCALRAIIYLSCLLYTSDAADE